MMQCAHIVAYYKHRANGNVCEAALLAAIYELAMFGETLNAKS